MEECIRRIRIADIKILDRIRKDLGDLEELARDIERNGLINFPVVTPDNVLIAGERRVRACQLLGWEEIPVKVMAPRDAEHQLLLEISENENRKDFTFSERMDYAQRLERIRAALARERSLSNLKQYQNNQDMVTDVQNFAPREYQKMVAECQNPDTREEAEVTGAESLLGSGKTRDKIAELVGFGSGETYRKAKFIAEHADPELIRRLDAGEISIHRAYQELKARLEAVEKAAEEAEARAEAERRRAEELAARLAEAEKALAEAKAGTAEAERYRAEVERLRRELEELRTRQPQVVEKVVEVPVEVEKVVYRPDPELEKKVKEQEAKLREQEARIRELERKLSEAGASEEDIRRMRAEKELLEKDLKRLRSSVAFLNKIRKLVTMLEREEEELVQLAEVSDLTNCYIESRRWVSVFKRYIDHIERAVSRGKVVDIELHRH
ncbi:ParB N-terminal domain-containing protein [Ammonifex thiophilus]|uniref:ParB N-terminal domain-containing protein n=1 Tax=Ammonifex thiophilus TaxID=444093 RepID=UPI00196BAAAA|nr:ParB N-terminal domain-containing protein [Ammonifex thiophilus]